MGVKEGKGTGKTMLSPGVAWKCQTWKNWPLTLGVYFTRLEVSQKRLLTSGVSENCGGPLRWRLKKFRPWQVKATVNCCRPRWGPREAGDAREKRYSIDEACPRMVTLSCLWPYLWPGAVCAPSGRCLVVGEAVAVALTPAFRPQLSLAMEWIPLAFLVSCCAYWEHIT